MLAMRVKRKAYQLEMQIKEMAKRGAAPVEFVQKAKQVRSLVERHKLREAEKLLDRTLALVDEEVSAGIIGNSPGRKGPSRRGAPDANRVGKYFKNPRHVKLHGYPEYMNAMEPFLSRDGKYLFWNSLNKIEIVNTNIYYATRINDFEFQFVGEVEGVNTKALEVVPAMDRNGNFYFVSPRPMQGPRRISYVGKFDDGKVTDIHLTPGITPKAAGWLNMDSEISADGQTKYYTHSEFRTKRGFPDTSYFVIGRKGPDGTFSDDPNSAKILGGVNDGKIQYAAAISEDELELFFTRMDEEKLKRKQPPFTIYRATRNSKTSNFEPPEPLTVFTGMFEAPTVAPGGKRLYYHQKVGDRWEIWTVERK